MRRMHSFAVVVWLGLFLAVSIAPGALRAAILMNNEGPDSVLDGFVIRDAYEALNGSQSEA